jgi:hypothetical protein
MRAMWRPENFFASFHSGRESARRISKARRSVLHGEYVEMESPSPPKKTRPFSASAPPMPLGGGFYHAGFEYPGGEGPDLSARHGTCEAAK